MKSLITITLGTLLICPVGFAGEQGHIEKNKMVNAEEAGVITGAPTGLHLRIVPNGFQLNWTLSSQDTGTVTGYEIVRADRFSGPHDAVAAVGKGTSQYVDVTALREIIYFYKVRAVAGKAYSSFSNTVSGER